MPGLKQNPPPLFGFNENISINWEPKQELLQALVKSFGHFEVRLTNVENVDTCNSQTLELL
jgi:hypothetical protein